MSRRLRFLAALLALFAFSAYFAEGVWASLCLPGSETHTSMVVGASDHGAHAGMNHAPGESSDDPGSPRSDAPPCPLGIAGAGSSCVAVSLPAAVTTVAQVAPGYAGAPLFLDSTHDLLVVASHFRPPRA
jgi:hypothetical protein